MKHRDSDIIDALGGTAVVAALCEVAPPSVSEWRKKGIPRARFLFLRAVRPDVFGPAPGVPPTVVLPKSARLAEKAA